MEKRQTAALFDRIADYPGLNVIGVAAMKSKIDDCVYTKFADQMLEQNQASGVRGDARTGDLKVAAGKRQKWVLFLFVYEQIQALHASAILHAYHSSSAFLDHAKDLLGTFSDGTAGDKNPWGIRLKG